MVSVTFSLFAKNTTRMLKLFLISVCLFVVEGVQFDLVNKLPEPIWVGIQGNSGKQHLNNGGMVLKRNQRISISAPGDWGGRFWARTHCDGRSKHCLTGDCGNKLQCHGSGGVPPASLVEIQCRGHGGLDYYDVSLVDGYNVPTSIEPVGGRGDGSQYSCKRSKCHYKNMNNECPNELKVWNRREPIGCKSACEAFKTDQYCCRGRFDKPETCRSSTWPKNYPAFFKKRCPDAYSYAYDDHKSTFTCKAPKYIITFGM